MSFRSFAELADPERYVEDPEAEGGGLREAVRKRCSQCPDPTRCASCVFAEFSPRAEAPAAAGGNR